ncbi:MAG TPA: hypothetical protein VH186_23145 [Chloroflexia bacterium]|nr:hypothetical protein [Chloroflexia bacterium]
MAQIILSGDGMTIEIEDEIARSDDLLKRALSPHYPDLANAFISREEKDGLLKVTVSKRAGPKGSYQADKVTSANPVVLALEEAPDYLNPALALAWQLYFQNSSSSPAGEGEGGLTLEKQLALQGEISDAILEGEAEASHLQIAIDLLKTAPHEPSHRLPKGF